MAELNLKLDAALYELRAFPFCISWLLDGRKLRPFLGDITGLGRARFRTDRAPPSGAEIIESARAHAIEMNLPSGAVSAIGIPGQPHEGFLYAWFPNAKERMTATISLSRRVDRLIHELFVAISNNDTRRVREGIMSWTSGRPEYLLLESTPAVRPAPELSSSVSDLAHAILRLSYNIQLEFMACLDLDFMFESFSPRFERIPLFRALLPQISDSPYTLRAQWQRDRKPGPKPKVVTAKRRLLELCFALLSRYHTGDWLNKEPSSGQLCEALDLEQSALEKRFIGDRAYKVDTFERDIDAMHEAFGGKSTTRPDLLPLLIGALYWDTLLAWDRPTRGRTKGKKHFLVSPAEYFAWWSPLRKQRAIQKPPNTEEWPAWLTHS